MDNIGRHRKTLLKQYAPRKEAVEIIASAKSLIEVALRSNHLLSRHRRKLISEALWWITEADGKHSTRFRTKEVYDLAMSSGSDEVKIQHEHVRPRSEVAKELLADAETYLAEPDKLEKLIEQTVGCIVTQKQHHSLKKGAKGWKRYQDIVVYDMKENPPAVFNYEA